MDRLETTIAGVKLKSPVMNASGTAAYGQQMAKNIDLNELGAFVIKSTTMEPRAGHPWPTTTATTGGWLNAVGLKNPGIEHVLAYELPWLAENYPDLPIVGSIAGSNPDDYVEVAKRMATAPNVKFIEVNISCPNVAKGGLAFGTDPVVVEDMTRRIKAVVSNKPVFMKLTPGVTEIVPIALAAERGGADGLVMINTLMGMEIDLETRKPRLSNGTGGLSGKAIHPIAVRMIHQVREVTNLPIIGVGGVFSAKDALELMVAGAGAVQVGSANYGNPHACHDIIQGLVPAMDQYHFNNIAEFSSEK
ncbi:dihydroorotate dehydrogenase [Pediococcus pentosaceus]|uniref:dihydroorotate dehydrogenase n=1 Tax=Pediococcus pentosaceus TaxID=1255 RepID=UPI0021AEA0BF|nr:dihydroorotate dehydrogenase [Pediococcus pentosaceus]MCT1177562.1 dihydroorotate dehydrogenase [Pediococcus pentosaceus]